MSTPFTDYTKPTETASRVAQLHNYIQQLRGGGTEWETCFHMLSAECRTLAAEVDARDEVITKLLEMLEPDGEHRPKQDSSLYRRGIWNLHRTLHARALEIAGRTE